MLKDYFYGSHNCPEELSEVLDKLESLLNNHTRELLKYTVLTDKRTKKKQLKNWKKNDRQYMMVKTALVS